MRPQFTLRSLLGFILFCAVLLSLLSTRVVPMLGAGGFTFWLFLLAPFWFPQFFVAPEARRRRNVRPLLALVPAAWYWMLVVLVHFARADVVPLFWSKVGAIGGTALACSILLPMWRGWWCLLGAPLGFAIVSGTVWFVLAVK